MLYPAGLWINLRELLLRGTYYFALMVEDDCPRAGGALVEGHYELGWHVFSPSYVDEVNGVAFFVKLFELTRLYTIPNVAAVNAGGILICPNEKTITA